MTTKGKALRRRNLRLVPIGPPDERWLPLYELPRLIGEAEALNGEPMEVEFSPDLHSAAQRLLATLGVRVRYSPSG